MIGVSPTYLSKIERDEFAPPVADKVRKIAAVIGCDADELLPGRTEFPRTCPRLSSTHQLFGVPRPAPDHDILGAIFSVKAAKAWRSGFPVYRTGLSEFEPSLCQHDVDIENLRPESRAENWHGSAEFLEFLASETNGCAANPRKSRDFAHEAEAADRDLSGWLGN